MLHSAKVLRFLKHVLTYRRIETMARMQNIEQWLTLQSLRTYILQT